MLTGDRDARQLEVLAPRQVFVDSDFLTGEADARLQPIRVPDDIEARHQTRPASGLSSVVKMRTAVVLPAPLGPSTANMLPA